MSRGIEDRGIEDRGVEDRGVEDRGIEDRGIEDRGVEDRGVEDRGSRNRGSGIGVTRREAVLAVGAALLAACFSDRPGPTDGNGNGNGDGATVDMTPQLVFDPATVTIRAGESVTWRNTSQFIHTATGDASKASDPSHVRLPQGASAWDSGDVSAGGQFTRTFDTPGEYRYFCIPHEANDMIGTVVVLSS